MPVTNIFTANTKARASEVNENFALLYNVHTQDIVTGSNWFTINDSNLGYNSSYTTTSTMIPDIGSGGVFMAGVKAQGNNITSNGYIPIDDFTSFDNITSSASETSYVEIGSPDILSNNATTLGYTNHANVIDRRSSTSTDTFTDTGAGSQLMGQIDLGAIGSNLYFIGAGFVRATGGSSGPNRDLEFDYSTDGVAWTNIGLIREETDNTSAYGWVTGSGITARYFRGNFVYASDGWCACNNLWVIGSGI